MQSDPQVILFDLDDTLILEGEAASEALRATAALAEERCGIDREELHQAVRRRARELWFAHPEHPYAKQHGIASWEALWARFEGPAQQLATYRDWMAEYRQQAWSAALAEFAVTDQELASRLAKRFPAERRRRHILYDETLPLLDELRAADRYRFGLITNGLSCLQREKIEGCGLAPYFESVTIAGEVGAAKPDPLPFKHALRNLAAEPAEALMIGNNPETDIRGARALGIPAIWVNRHGQPAPDGSFDQIAALMELPARLTRAVRS